MRHAVIMAGGAGVRLWPLSRQARPKQLLKLFSGTSLLRQSYERVSTVLPPECINVITGQNHLPLVAEEIPELPAANLFGEPCGRDTVNAVGLASAIIAERDPDAVVGIFTADHIITPLERFASAVHTGFETAEAHDDALVTFGIRPSRPDTNYGYIQRGERVSDGVFRVSQFTEKPNMAEAMKYVAGGDFYWNSGMFAWRADTILGEIQRHLPASYEPIREMGKAWSTDARQQIIERIYPSLMKISIDFAVMEKAEHVLAVEMDCHWVDVGSWPAIETVVSADADGNVNACPRSMHLASRGNIVVSEQEHLIATIGVDDLVIIHAPDATLVCKRRDASAIKELVGNIHEKYGDTYA